MSGAGVPAIPGFTVLSLAGQGGMGTVYKAEQASPRRVVALKVLKARGDPESSDLQAFQREARLIARLEHPHIVPLYDFGEHEGSPYLVLRFFSGGSVADRLRQGAIPLPIAVRWLSSIADALAFAHERGLVHRDIKPSNALLDDAGNAYLTDFGIAGTLESFEGQAPSGSAAYMSPEQGRAEAVDARSDVYSLAVMAFEMLTGQRPYTAESAIGLIVRHINDPIPSARALNPAVPAAVDALIRQGMAKDPAQRPQSAQEFGRLLRQAVAPPGSPTGDRTEAASSPPQTMAIGAAPQRRGGAMLWLGGVLAIGLCLVGGGTLLGGGTLAALLFSRATPTAAPLPTAAPPPTTAPPTQVPTPEGQLLVDDFSVPDSGFAVAKDADGGVGYVDGALRIDVLTRGIEWFSPSERISAVDVSIEVDVRQIAGPGGIEMAVLCRWQGPGDYTAFAISGEGTYSIWQKRGGEVSRLQDWTAAPSLEAAPGEAHRLRATCAGSTLRLEVDGIGVGEATALEPASGDIALMAGLRESGEASVVFDNLRVTR